MSDNSGLLPILDAPALFKQCRLDPGLNAVRTVAGLDCHIFDALMKEPIYRYAEAVQLAPASENHHHSGPGGLLIHTLDVIALALKMRKGFQLPLGGSLADIGRERHMWTYGVFIACLLHDIGKLSSSIRLNVLLQDGTHKYWTPQGEPLTTKTNVTGYSVEFVKSPYQYHTKLSLIHFHLLPTVARDWLMQSRSVMQELLAYLWGDRFESGTIGEIAERADRESTARNLQIPVEKSFSKSIPTIERYLRLIRQWLDEGLIRTNVSGSMGWVDNDGHVYLVCRALAEKLIFECSQMGLDNLPQNPVRVYDILQEHGYALSNDQGKAIWTIKVKTEEFDHQLTCLKFDARRLRPPNKSLSPFAGSITIIDKAERESDMEESIGAIEAAPEPVAATHEVVVHTGSESKAENETVSKLASLSLAGKSQSETSSEAAEQDLPPKETASGSQAAEEESTENPQETPDEPSQTATETAFDFSAKDTPRRFLSWLKKGLIEKTILINEVNAEVHIVKEGIFLLAPAIFKTWISLQGLDGEKYHKNLSRRFARLRIHLRNEGAGMNVHSYWVSSSNRATKINGWIIPFSQIYENDYPIPNANKYLSKELGGH